MIRFDVDDAHAAYSNITLKLLVSLAYRTSDARISGADGWMDSDFFDVNARLPAGATKEQIPDMLKALLAERFGLVAHTATKMMPSYDLAVAKGGPKIQPAKPDAKAANFFMRDRIEGPRMSMGGLADILGRLTGRPVKDRTGVEGDFDIHLRFTPEDAKDMLGREAPSIYTALREQLGLELRPAKEQIEFVAIDKANRAPAEN